MWLAMQHRNCAITPTSPLWGRSLASRSDGSGWGLLSMDSRSHANAWERSSAALRPLIQEAIETFLIIGI